MLPPGPKYMQLPMIATFLKVFLFISKYVSSKSLYVIYLSVYLSCIYLPTYLSCVFNSTVKEETRQRARVWEP